MKNSLKISTKLYGLAAIFMSSILLCGVYGIWTMNSIGHELEGIVDADIPVANALSLIAEHQLEQSVLFERGLRFAEVRMNIHPAFARDASHSDLKRLMKEFETLGRQVDEEIRDLADMLEGIIRTARSQALRDEMKTVLQRVKAIEAEHKDYEDHAYEVFQDLLDFEEEILDTQFAKSLAAEVLDDEKLRIHAYLEELEAAERQVVEEEEHLNKELLALVEEIEGFTLAAAQTAEEHEKSALSRLSIIIVSSILLSLLGVIIIVRGITIPINAAVIRMAELARGDIDGDILVRTRDELGILLESIQRFILSLRATALAVNRIAKGDLNASVEVKGEKDTLAKSINAMAQDLRKASEVTAANDWHKTGLGRLNECMAGDLGLVEISERVVTELATYLDAQVAALYLADGRDDKTVLTLTSSYAYTMRKNLSNQFRLGEGLVGQAAKEKQQILLRNVPDDYIKVTSALGEKVPAFICVTPFIIDGRVKGVVEIATLSAMTRGQLQYLAEAMPPLAIAIQSAQNRTELAESLEESRAMSEELQAQQEELKASNEELEEQSQALKASEEELRAQQEELAVTNEELGERNRALEDQKRAIEQANTKLDLSRKELEEKAEALALASKYKSEFLANMSHELRTPLNSLLILSKSLADNEQANLDEEQVQAAQIIHGSGSDLLSLINEILDLSKIEAGQMNLELTRVKLESVRQSIRTGFGHVVAQKGISLEVTIEPGVEPEIVTDSKRLDQVLRNLLSNAIKFTAQGGVSVSIGRPAPGVNLSASGLNPAESIAFKVSDTGIGIPANKQKVIFEAFQQAEGGTARKYGGTGLGLSISRELAHLLGGEIQLESEEGKGSTFTFFVPVIKGEKDESRSAVSRLTPVTVRTASGNGAPGNGAPEPARTNGGAARTAAPPAVKTASAPTAGTVPAVVSSAVSVQPATLVEDDRAILNENDTVTLIIEDDPVFAKVLRDQCRAKGLKCLVGGSGEDGLALAMQYLPQAIILDVGLPGIDGVTVLEVLKNQIRTRHIPVHVISGAQKHESVVLGKGALGFMTKPVTKEQLDQALGSIESMLRKKVKDLLVVEDNPGMRKAITKLIGSADVNIEECGTGEEVLRKVAEGNYDCMILDIGLPDINGFDLLDRLSRLEGSPLPPVVIYTGRELSKEEETKLLKYTDSVIVKGVRSEERLLDEVSLFLHRAVGDLPQLQRKTIIDLHESDKVLENKLILIVDDDMRNTFALSKTLGARGMRTIKAENGQRALDELAANPEIDMILMDIMMPVMDGYETMRRIRKMDQHRRLPIIALTAKAMEEDRKLCINAGANDYMTKPVDIDRLVSMMRVWLYK